MDNEALAAALYGSPAQPEAKPTEAPAAGTTPRETDPNALADALYRNPDDALDPVTRLDKLYAVNQREIVAEGERLGLDPEEARQASDEWAARFRQHEVSSTDASTLTSVAAAVMSGHLVHDPAAWTAQAREALATEFGQNAEAALAAGRQLLASDPELRAFLDRTGLGDHPAVVRVAALRGWEAKKAGRLR